MANGIVLPNAHKHTNTHAECHIRPPHANRMRVRIHFALAYDVFGLVLMYAMFAHIELADIVVGFDSDGGVGGASDVVGGGGGSGGVIKITQTQTDTHRHTHSRNECV